LPFWPPVITDATGRFLLRGLGRNLGVGLEVADDRFPVRAWDVPAEAGERHDEVRLILAVARRSEGRDLDADICVPLPRGLVPVLIRGQALALPELPVVPRD
jgi:hypothetical protein